MIKRSILLICSLLIFLINSFAQYYSRNNHSLTFINYHYTQEGFDGYFTATYCNYYKNSQPQYPLLEIRGSDKYKTVSGNDTITIPATNGLLTFYNNAAPPNLMGANNEIIYNQIEFRTLEPANYVGIYISHYGGKEVAREIYDTLILRYDATHYLSLGVDYHDKGIHSCPDHTSNINMVLKQNPENEYLQTGDVIYGSVSPNPGFCFDCNPAYRETITRNLTIKVAGPYNVKPVTADNDSTLCPSETKTLSVSGTPAETIDYWVKTTNGKTSYFGYGQRSVSISEEGNYYVKYYDRHNISFESESITITAQTSKCSYARISGNIWNDQNSDDINNPGENNLPGVAVIANPGEYISFSDENGNYSMYLPAGNTYNITARPPRHHKLSFPTQPYTIVVPHSGITVAENRNIGLSQIPVSDLSITTVSSRQRPGFRSTYTITVENKGTVPSAGNVKFEPDNQLVYLQSVPSASSQDGNKSEYTVPEMSPGSKFVITIYDSIPVDLTLGTAVSAKAIIESNLTDANPADNNFTLRSVITGSFDPNDKLVFPGGDAGFIRPDDQLTYTIRFQNTGTDTAFTVKIKDTISPLLDLTTLTIISSSHPCKIVTDTGRVVTWTFNNILLPDQKTNDAGSNGFVCFAIRQRAGNNPGTIIKNKAGIYFDFNKPVITNEVISNVSEDIVTSFEKTSSDNSVVFPNPAGEFVIARYPAEADIMQILSGSGTAIETLKLSGTESTISTSGLPSGIYFYRITDKSGENISTGKFVKE